MLIKWIAHIQLLGVFLSNTDYHNGLSRQRPDHMFRFRYPTFALQANLKIVCISLCIFFSAALLFLKLGCIEVCKQSPAVHLQMLFFFFSIKPFLTESKLTISFSLFYFPPYNFFLLLFFYKCTLILDLNLILVWFPHTFFFFLIQFP